MVRPGLAYHLLVQILALSNITAAASEIKPGGKNESTVGSGRAVLVLSLPPKVFNTETELFVRVPDNISSDIGGALQSIPMDNFWIVGVHVTVNKI